MECFVCKGEMIKYFVKENEWGGVFRHEYVRCKSCGLVIDKTAYDTDISQLLEDIYKEHSYQGKAENNVDPRWIERIRDQAQILAKMFHMGIFANDARIVDYGCGDGKLSDAFQEEYTALSKKEALNSNTYPCILKYDKFMRPQGDESYISEKDVGAKSFDAVISCSVFEHLFGRRDIEPIFELLNDTGTFCLHVLVCEEVPNDPEWFYLLPDHVTIWTNRAMDILYKEHGFIGCAYHVEARMWFFFKDRLTYEKLQKKQALINGTWVFSDQFVDYWKQKPYRS